MFSIPESLATQRGLVLAKAASRIALYFIREECDNPMEHHELQHAHDYFVVNSAKVTSKNHLYCNTYDLDCILYVTVSIKNMFNLHVYTLSITAVVIDLSVVHKF